MDNGFKYNNVITNKEPLQKVHSKSSDLSIAYKLTHKHLNVNNIERQKVKQPTQLLSHKNSHAISWLVLRRYSMSNNWKEVSDFIKLPND